MIRWHILQHVCISQFGTYPTISCWEKVIPYFMMQNTEPLLNHLIKVFWHSNHLKKAKTQSIGAWIEEITCFNHVLYESDSSPSLTKAPENLSNVIDSTWETWKSSSWKLIFQCFQLFIYKALIICIYNRFLDWLYVNFCWRILGYTIRIPIIKRKRKRKKDWKTWFLFAHEKPFQSTTLGCHTLQQ